jgi:hypothetical protein
LNTDGRTGRTAVRPYNGKNFAQTLKPIVF